MPTIVDLAKAVTHKDTDYKMKTYDKIERLIEKDKTPNGDPLPASHKQQLKTFLRWLMMNILVGEELAPADNVLNY